MPASNVGSYLQDARNNFDAVRPALVCADANQSIGQCQNVHISTNCYYGYHDLKTPENNHVDTDCEMVAVELPDGTLSKTSSRKRSADEDEYPQRKRLREEGMVPSTSNYNPCLLRPTHNNPDISRCLMVHMMI
ncbi:uncharacterized protein LOC110378242 [Helicoverpa armigera]|uniref:uncharacterized protein LOC110378242 n=1 Tax=Helicoverpa armigera TaxID=29058 RepID=UPI000B3A24AC|nr:uncharacterized protein LOC110378242 isoform X2 [Helicoverpa armigera]XP_047023777.1 uncharacterized protein LOC124632836 isoform X3 [Helicoverpa zea]